MAAIDKVYGTHADHVALVRFMHGKSRKHRSGVYPLLVSDYDDDGEPTGKRIALFGHLTDDAERPISNFRVRTDKWLARHCTVPVVLARLAYVQYPSSKTGRLALERLHYLHQRYGTPIPPNTEDEDLD